MLDTVSTVVIVLERLGVGNPLNEAKSQVIAFFGTGLVELVSEGTAGRSLLMLLVVLLTLTVSLSGSAFSRRPPTIHHTPDGFRCTLISSVL